MLTTTPYSVNAMQLKQKGFRSNGGYPHQIIGIDPIRLDEFSCPQRITIFKSGSVQYWAQAVTQVGVTNG